MPHQDDLLTSAETAALLGIRTNTLEVWRSTKGKGPVFVKFGDSPQARVRYRRSKVMEWLEAQSFANTSAYSPAARTSAKSTNCPPSRQASGASA